MILAELVLSFALLRCVMPQREISALQRSKSQCDCMEYWQCVEAGGKPYSYCSYSNKVCCFVDSNARSVGILPRARKLATCGTKGVDSGKDNIAEPGEWAWHAAILEKNQDLYVCGGALLDELWVLTAAHCIDEYKTPQALKVRLGEYDVSSTREPLKYEEFDVVKVFAHPEFNNKTLLHDIAMLKLSKPASRRQHINVVCMPNDGITNEELISSRCYVTGWGKTAENSDHSVVLKEVNVPLWRNVDCERALQLHFGTSYKLPATTLCAGAEGRDACEGDGGSPLVCEKNDQWYQVGIVSFGIGCGRQRTPGIYTRVESYNNWIYDIVLKS